MECNEEKHMIDFISIETNVSNPYESYLKHL